MASKGPTTEKGHAGAFVSSWNDLAGGATEQVAALRWPMSVKTYHRMRSDSQVDALLRSVTLPIRRYSWHLEPHGARPEVVRHVAADLGISIAGEEDPPRTRKRFSHDDHLRHALLGLVYGHMFFEQVGRVDDDLLWRLSKLAPRMPQSITEIKVADDGGLVHVKQNAKNGAYGGQKISIDRLVAYVWEREGGDWTGRSMLRPLYSHYLIKDRLIRIDALKNERFGMGIPTGHAPQGGDPDEYAALAAAIRAGENTGVGLPHGASIGVEGITGSLPDTIGSIRYHDEQMARTFLAMFMQLGSTQTGSRALGDSFVDFFELSLEAIANWYADVTNQHVVEDIVDWNYGEDEEAPELVWQKDEAQDLGVDEMGKLIELGILTVDDEIQHWVRDRYRLPPPSDDSSGSPAQTDDDEPLEDWARDVDGLSEVAARRVRAHLPGKHDQRDHGRGTSNVAFASQEEWDSTLQQANAKIAAAPVPSQKAVAKARADLANAKRAGGDSRGGSAADRRRQRENLFKEFGGEEKGYVVCHMTGMKLHWSADPALNPDGFPLLERGKIFTKGQGGAYRLSNLLPESFLGNRSRNNEPVRSENMSPQASAPGERKAMKTETLAKWIGSTVTAKRMGWDAEPDDDLDLTWQDEGLPAEVEGPLDVFAVDVIGDIVLVAGQPVDPETVVLPGNVSAHLPGQHDQKSHGRRGGGAGAGAGDLTTSDSGRQMSVAQPFIDSAPPEFAARLEEALERAGPRLDHIVEQTGLEHLSSPTSRGEDTMGEHSEWAADGTWMGYTEERREWHEELLTELNERNASAGTDRQAVIMAGMPGAGKTYLLQNELGEEIQLDDFVTVNADDIKVEIVNGPNMVSMGDLSGMELASLAHEESSHLAKVWQADLISQGRNVALDITAANEAKTLRMIADLREAGYTVSVVHADVTPVEAMISAVERFESSQRIVPLEFIAGMADSPGSSTDAIATAFDSYREAVNGNYYNYRSEPVRQIRPTLIERGP